MARVGSSLFTHVGAPKDDVISGVSRLSDSRKGDHSTASLKSLFNDYDSGSKGCLNKDDLIRLLNDAGVSITKAYIPVPQGLVADGILDELNTSKTRCLTWEEYKAGAGVTDEPGSPSTLYVPAEVLPAGVVALPPSMGGGYLYPDGTIKRTIEPLKKISLVEVSRLSSLKSAQSKASVPVAAAAKPSKVALYAAIVAVPVLGYFLWNTLRG